MRPVDRYRFIEDWLKKRSDHIPYYVDCLDSEFVDAYIDHTGATFQCMVLGAHRCNQLSRDLATMAETGRLYRWRSGLHGAISGFPKWVWCYGLPKEK